MSDKDATIKAGEKIMQGVFTKFFKVNGDKAKGIRKGGFGSTN